MMIINHISIRNFRNLCSVNLAPHHRLNFLTGSNAQGKSNFLEALGILSNGRSFRRARESELINWSESFARIEAMVCGTEEDSLEISFTLMKVLTGYLSSLITRYP